MVDICIRLLLENDIPQLSQKLSSAPAGYSKYFTPFDFHENEIKKIILTSRSDKYWGIFIEENLAGFFMLRGFDEGYEIPAYGVWISNEYANKGLAKLTLEYAISFCKLNHIKEMMLKVHPENVVAKHLYEKRGFTQVGVDSHNSNLVYRITLSDN